MKHTPTSQFDTAHLTAKLKELTVRGGLTTLGAQGINFILNLAATAILARLLRPSDFGLVAMVTAVTGLLAMFKDAGLSMATVQKDTITHEQISNLFWLNVALSLALMVAVAAFSPLIAYFYDEPNLLPITLAIAAVFVFDGLAVQHQALLRRQMRFGALAKIQIISTALALAAAVGSAMAGFGYWALIVQIAVSQIVGAVLSWSYSCWLPSLPRRNVGTRPLINFGGFLTGFSFVNYLARNADNVLIGNFWGSYSLGLYSKAYGLLLMPLQQINRPIAAVAIPALSRLQYEPERFREFFIHILRVIAFITFPLIAWMIICRREIILLLLGSQWEGAIPIFGVLAISSFFQPIGNITGVLYTALGRTKRMFACGVTSSLIIVGAFVIGLPYGPIGVAWAYSVTICLVIYPLIKYAISGTCIRASDFWEGIKIPALATAASAIAGFAADFIFIDPNLDPINIMAIGLAIILTYLFTIRILDRSVFASVLTIIRKRY